MTNTITVEYPQSPLRATHVDGKIVVALDDVQAHITAVAAKLDAARANPEIGEALRKVVHQFECLR